MKRPAHGFEWELVHARRFFYWGRGTVARMKRAIRRRERHDAKREELIRYARRAGVRPGDIFRD